MAYARNNVNLDNWDPMRDSYHDANINCYEQGPGVHLTPHARPSANAQYQLHVKDIPLELTQNGIRQVFDLYGQTTGVMSPPGATWAYVTYRSFREAEAAIRALNKQPPMQLSVTFSKPKADDRNGKPNSLSHCVPNMEPAPGAPAGRRLHSVRPEQCPPLARPFACNLARGQPLVNSAGRAAPSAPGLPPYPAAHDRYNYDPYEDAELFAPTNNMWTREKLQTSGDGTRFVGMGRGYGCYRLPAQHPKVNQQVRAMYENRQAGLYQYGEPLFSQPMGNCQNCTRQTMLRTQCCREFYCSNACQNDDWPRHRNECQPDIPRSEGIVDSRSISVSSGEETTVQQEPKRRSVRKLGGGMRHPIKPAGPTTALNSGATRASVISPQPETQLTTPDEIPELKVEKDHEPSAAKDRFKRGASGDRKEVSHQSEPINKGGWTPLKNVSDLKPLRNCNNQEKVFDNNQRPDFLNYPPPSIDKENNRTEQETNPPPGENSHNQNLGGADERNASRRQGGQSNRNFFKRGERGCSDELDDRAIGEEMKNLNIRDPRPALPKPKPSLEDPDVGFYKATEMVAPSGMKSPPETSHRESKKTVSAVAGHSETLTPANAVESRTDNSTRETKSSNVVDLLNNGDNGCFEVHALLGGNKAAVTVCVEKVQEDYCKLFGKLTEECNAIVETPPFDPKIGDSVCGKRDDDWIRGTVASLGPPIRVAAMDEGRIEPVTDIKRIPAGYETLPTLGAICEVTEGEINLEAIAQYTFLAVDDRPAKVVGDGVKVVIFTADEKEGRGILKPWTAMPRRKAVPYATLTSGTEVYVVSYRSHAMICARSLVQKEMELFHRVTQDVARWSAQVSPMSEYPIPGEMVISKFIDDGNFYRAIVRKIEGDKITVSYVDFGNIEITSLANIRPISDELEAYPSFCAKIILKGVPKDIPMNKEVDRYIRQLLAQETPLMCTFEGSPEDGVILKSADGAIVNDTIKDLLTPSWEKPQESQDNTTVYTLADIEVAELGEVGQEVNVIVLCSYGPLLHAMAPQDQDLLTHVAEVMAAQMGTYCKEVKDHYIPRQNELCLAPYKGSWYRAVCLEHRSAQNASLVNFIDYGNIETIGHTDLRAITKDFVTTKSLASICSVVGLGAVNEEGELPAPIAARVTELVVPENITTIKIVECTKPGEYTVELPKVRDILVKEGLLKLR